MPLAIIRGLTRDHVPLALADLDTNQAFLDVRNQTFCMANPFGMEPVVVPSGIRRTGPLRCNGGGRLL